MDAPGLKNIRGTLQLMDKALTSHIEDATKEADRIKDSVDRDNSRDGKLVQALKNLEVLEDTQAFISRASQHLLNLVGNI